jgi:hypothetical protein
VRLDPADIEAISRRVAELIASANPEPRARYVDAAQLARVLGVERNWVYAHAHELGAVRLGGAGGRLRFDLEHVARALSSPLASGPAPRPARPASNRAARRRTDVDLLPYES